MAAAAGGRGAGRATAPGRRPLRAGGGLGLGAPSEIGRGPRPRWGDRVRTGRGRRTGGGEASSRTGPARDGAAKLEKGWAGVISG